MSVRQEYFLKMVNKLNENSAFNYANIRFSSNNNNFHFVERFGDRKLDIKKVLPIYYKFILRHRCEIIYYCYLDNAATRLELEYDNMILGLSLNNKSLAFRTIIDKWTNRKDGQIPIFRISNQTKYYE